MITLVKFIRNYKETSSNKLISRTLGKLGVLPKGIEVQPKHNEWWYCDILKEVGHGTERGVFVLNPLKPLPYKNGRQEILFLFPGSFTIVRRNNVLMMLPDKPGHPWVCPTPIKRHLINKHKTSGRYALNAIIVVHGGTSEWPIEDY